MQNGTTELIQVSLAKAFVIRKKVSDLIRKEDDILIKFPVYTYQEGVESVKSGLTQPNIEAEFAFFDRLLQFKADLTKAIEDKNQTGQSILADINRVDAAIRVETNMLNKLKSTKNYERTLDSVHGTYIVTNLVRTGPDMEFLKSRIAEGNKTKSTLEDALAKHNADTVVQFPIDTDIKELIGF